MNAEPHERRPHERPIVELDQRSGEDMVVTLLWSRRTGSVFVSVQEKSTDVEFHFPVDPANALDAFRHPYAYRGAPSVSRFPVVA
jgi:hypothetical protein